MQNILRLVAITIILSCCDNYKTKYPYSIAHFRTELRPYLEKIVEAGGHCDERKFPIYQYLSENASVKELQQLTLSEHPLLRATAFRILCNMGGRGKEVIYATDLNDSAYNNALRKNSDLTDNLLLEHLDDTAIITYCAGEWGDRPIYVSDYYLDQSEGKTKIIDSLLEDEVIKKHNYLNHAYEFIKYLKKKKENYYTIIKAMVIRDNAWTKDEQYQILAELSEYKKPEDVALIAHKLPHFNKWNSHNSFFIIERNPDTAYFKFLKNFYLMFKNTRINKEFAIPYNNSLDFQDKYLSFLSALAAYKNQQCLDILIEILDKKIYPEVQFSYDELKWRIYNTLKEYECPLYNKLIVSLKTKALEYKKNNTLPETIAGINLYESGYW